MSYSIAGKTAIVTGAANGVGLAIARHFVKEGANVMMADLDEERLAAEADAITTEDSRPRFFAGDLREKLTQANLLSATLDEFDRVDILVNASRQVLRSDPLNPDEDAFETLIQQNVVANLRLSQLIAKRMIRQAEEAGDAEAPVLLAGGVDHRERPELAVAGGLDDEGGAVAADWGAGAGGGGADLALASARGSGPE